ncbi:enolase C-terminal domain-like protein [Mycolicibacterium poriferae]|uniref:enolase C-terminal domain-like protein n=1 Tax=Mycolicibacterium poriferae TaxID=39694 RepID=UPI0013D4D781|nr:enolase C-terminal domain-like protein [Mycolicibacterium poriferae]MCV7265790.1 mandelate racemase [Mycolicibacterium poriferae]
MTSAGPTIDHVQVDAFSFPTPNPEADGTLEWDATTAVTVRVHAGGKTGLGWTYSSPAAATLISAHFVALLRDHDAHDITAAVAAMRRKSRNFGIGGLAMQAISAVDVALWDLKAKLLDVPLAVLLGKCRTRVPIYGSGGFVTASDSEISKDVAAWKAAGCRAMKIKIGKSRGDSPKWDLERVALFRELARDGVELMVDANGAYQGAEAIRIGTELERWNVRWFEEPVSSDDIEGLALARSGLRCDVAAGEYISTPYEAERLAAVVDCLQVDATRCGGYTGFLQMAAIASAHNLEVSAHCAPALHAPVAAAVPNLRHVEWFNDHVRLEPMLLDGVAPVDDGAIVVQCERPGHGMTLSDGVDGHRVRVKVG